MVRFRVSLGVILAAFLQIHDVLAPLAHLFGHFIGGRVSRFRAIARAPGEQHRLEGRRRKGDGRRPLHGRRGGGWRRDQT